MTTPLRSRGSLLGLALLAASGCIDSARHPLAPSVLQLAIPAELTAAMRSSLGALASVTGSLGDVHFHIEYPPGPPIDTVIPFPAGTDQASFSLTIPRRATNGSLFIAIELRVGAQVYYAGSTTVAVADGTPGATQPITMSYVGPVNDIAFAFDTASVIMTDTASIVAMPLDLAGHLVSGRTVTYTTSAPAIATVSSTGVVTGISRGVATIRATSEGKADSIAVRVRPSFTTISAGFDFTCGLTIEGEAYCWGRNNWAQLGNGTLDSVSMPGPVRGGLTFTKLAAGGQQVCALTQAGATFCWGYGYGGQLANGEPIHGVVPTAVAGGPFATISGGTYRACALTPAGAPFCWGYNGVGALGTGTTQSASSPVAVAMASPVAQLVAGIGNTTCAIDPNSRGYCWGNNGRASVGDGSTVNRLTPTPIAPNIAFAQIGGGWDHTCGLSTAGAAYCWGSNDSGRVGDGTTTQRVLPTAVSGGHVFVELVAGGHHSCGRKATGDVYCWGVAASGQIGNGTFTGQQLTPVRVNATVPFVQLAVGGWHTCARTAKGGVYCWGSNYQGAVGDGTLIDKATPARIRWPQP